MDLRGNCETCPQQCSSCHQGDDLVCNECKTGFWGYGCSLKCFEGCTYGMCHITEGYCLKGCREGFSNSLCDISKYIYIFKKAIDENVILFPIF